MNLAVRKQTDVFCFHFILLSIILFGIFGLLPDNLYAPVTKITASIVHRLLMVAGLHATVHENYLAVQGFSVYVIPECTALFISLLYTSFVLSFPAQWKCKLIGLASGLPVLFTVNQIRLLFLCVVGLKWPRLFDMIHVYAGQVFLTAILILMIILWIRFSMNKQPGHRSMPFLLGFLFISTLLFIPWVYLNHSYMRCIDFLIKIAFSMFDYNLSFSITTHFYYETFNLIIFAGLILAPRNIPDRIKLHYLAQGVFILFLGHIGIRLAKVFKMAFDSQLAIYGDQLLYMTTVYLMPILLWVYFRHQYARHMASLTCPLCGKHQRNTMAHIRAVQAQDALSSTDIQTYF